jgi:hypothetical protein
MKSLKMKNPPHPGLSVCADCPEAHDLSVTDVLSRALFRD